MTGNARSTLGIYTTVYLSLIGFLALTVVVAHFSLERWAIPVSLAIASMKAALVMIYFMHLKQSPRLTWVVATGALIWFFILLLGVLADDAARF